jgi:hypothetical protein
MCYVEMIEVGLSPVAERMKGDSNPEAEMMTDSTLQAGNLRNSSWAEKPVDSSPTVGTTSAVLLVAHTSALSAPTKLDVAYTESTSAVALAEYMQAHIL